MLCVIVSVMDLNPASVRYFTVPETLSAAGFFDTCAVVYGLDPKRVTVRLDERYNLPAFLESVNGMDPENTMISSLFHVGDIFRLRLNALGMSDFLILRVEIADIQSDQQIMSDVIPIVTMAVGLNLPRNVFRTDEICYRFRTSARRIRTGYGSEAGKEDEIQFDYRRTENKLRQLFAPETALPEVKMELGRPLQILLESLKVADLKMICEEAGAFSYGNMNKASYIWNLQEHMDGIWLRNLLEHLPLEELQTLWACAFGETEITAAVSGQLKLQRLGLLVRTRDGGMYYASELLNVLNKLNGTEEKTKLMVRSACRTALRACAVYYTVFSEKMYLRVLHVLLPEISCDVAREILEIELNSTMKDDIWYDLRQNQTSGRFIFNSKMVKAADAKRISSMNLHNEASTYLPTREEIMYAASHDVTPMETELIRAVLEKAASVFYDQWSLAYLIGKLRTGLAPEKVAEGLKKDIGYRVYLRSVFDDIQSVLKDRLGNLPVAALGGFTRRNVPREVLLRARSVKAANLSNKSVK